MVIALIHWKIEPDRVEEFLEFWQKKAVVQDRSGLVGEFLSEVGDAGEFPWVTWDLADREGVYRSYVNVGLWRNADDFHHQIARYFNDDTAPESFESERRVRAILRPLHWRVGYAELPIQDSGGTL